MKIIFFHLDYQVQGIFKRFDLVSSSFGFVFFFLLIIRISLWLQEEEKEKEIHHDQYH